MARTAIVTGSSGAIGSAVAMRLAHDGFAVSATYAGNPAKANGVVKKIKSTGGQAIAVQADVASAADEAHKNGRHIQSSESLRAGRTSRGRTADL